MDRRIKRTIELKEKVRFQDIPPNKELKVVFILLRRQLEAPPGLPPPRPQEAEHQPAKAHPPHQGPPHGREEGGGGGGRCNWQRGSTQL